MSTVEILDEDRGCHPDGIFRRVKTTTVYEEVGSLQVLTGGGRIELVYVEGRGPFTTVEMTSQEARHIASLLLAAAAQGDPSDD